MINISNQVSKAISGQNNSQSNIANLQNQYQYAILSGEGSFNQLRDQLAKEMLALGYKRQDESMWVQQQKDNLRAHKDLIGLSTFSTAA